MILMHKFFHNSKYQSKFYIICLMNFQIFPSINKFVLFTYYKVYLFYNPSLNNLQRETNNQKNIAKFSNSIYYLSMKTKGKSFAICFPSFSFSFHAFMFVNSLKLKLLNKSFHSIEKIIHNDTK